MKKYENDFVYGRERLRILLIATAIGCALSFLTPQYTYVQVACMCMTVVLFVTSIALIFKYCRCPNCHRKMELYLKGKEDTFICSTCGYKEKLSSFQARREKEGAGVSKRDVQRYLNKQRKEAQEPINNAFAQALAKINLKED